MHDLRETQRPVTTYLRVTQNKAIEEIQAERVTFNRSLSQTDIRMGDNKNSPEDEIYAVGSPKDSQMNI